MGDRWTPRGNRVKTWQTPPSDPLRLVERWKQGGIATAQRLLAWIFFFFFSLFSSTLLLGLSTETGISWCSFFSPCVGMDCRVGWVGWKGSFPLFHLTTSLGRSFSPPHHQSHGRHCLRFLLFLMVGWLATTPRWREQKIKPLSFDLRAHGILLLLFSLS